MKSNMNQSLLNSIEAGIKSHGHAVIGVTDAPPFTYTIGLSDLLGFELINIGVPPHYATAIMNDIAAAIKTGACTIEFGVPDDRFANLPMMFMNCDQRVREYVIQLDAYYGRAMPVVQLVASDKNGLLPHQEGFDIAYMENRQLLLYKM